MDAEGYHIIWPLLISALGAGLVVVWARWRWSKLKPELFPEEGGEGLDEEESAPKGGGLGSASWLQNVPGLLAGVRHALERERTPEAQTLLEAARRVEAAAPELPAAVRSLISRAVESGELSSLLVGRQGLYAYVVAVPNRHEHPHLLRRYAPFSAGWAEHADVVRASLASSGDFSAVLAYLFFLSPDAKDGLLLVSYASAETLLVPSRLLQGSRWKGGACKAVDAALEFKMSD